jgi:steroid 5-alpha reductase family enzyme
LTTHFPAQILWVTFFLFFFLRQLICTKVWIVSIPVVILNSPAISDVKHGGSNPAFGTSRDVAGIVLWSLGLFIEATADMQKVGVRSHRASKVEPVSVPIQVFKNHFKGQTD